MKQTSKQTNLPAPSAKQSDEVFVVPSRVILLGEAIQPVAKNLRLALTRRYKYSSHEMATFEDLAQHMNTIAQAFSQLSPRIVALMSNIISDEKAGMAEVYREAGRLEEVLSEFVAGYRLAKISRPSIETSEARKLLLDIYRHYIREICEWLEELVQAIENPISAIEKRGLLLIENVELSVPLNLTSPIEAKKLNDLAKRLQLECESVIEPVVETEIDRPTDFPVVHDHTENSRPGIFATIGALVFGVNTANAIFRR